MKDVGIDRIIFGIATLPFVIFAFVRIFVRENRLVDETFIERAREELKELRERCERLTKELDDMQTRLRAERRRANRLEDELADMRARLPGIADRLENPDDDDLGDVVP